MSKTKNVLLIYPKTGMDFGSTVAPPHSLLAIAAPLHKDGYRIKIIDQRVDRDWNKHLDEELKLDPICVGISSMTGMHIYFALEAAKIVKAKTKGSVPMVWGGPHPSILPEQTLKSDYVDVVCVGEGDIAFYEIVKAIENNRSLAGIKGIAFKDGDKITVNPPAPLIDIETLLPVPWELIDVESYIHPDMYLKKSSRTLDIGQTSRGCPFNCGFCCSASLRRRKWRAMSVGRSLQAIIEPIKKFNLNGIWIRDDEFYIDRDRASKICDGILKENLNINWYTSGTRVDVFNKASDDQTALLKKSGAYVLKYGAESGSNRILKLINKGIVVEDTLKANLKAKKHGITPAFSLMVGFPTQTFEEIDQTIDLMFKLKKDNPAAQFEAIATYTALPGTPMYDVAVQNGLKTPENLEGWINWNFIDYDLSGERIPWFNASDRKKIGNICYMSILANGFRNAIDSIENVFLRSVLRVLYIPLSLFYRFRLKHKWYNFSWDLMVVRYIRARLFYKSYMIIK